MITPKFSVVIHAEEEFDWDGGFYPANTAVTHGAELIRFVDALLDAGANVTLAMDYPFITSEDGKRVVSHFKHLDGERIEFATHLHPWVNPPIPEGTTSVTNRESFPGNLSEEEEYAKLKALTDEIERVTGTRPVTYLAGRYGIGKHSRQILKSLGYKVDLSVSAYTDFSRNEGPDFSLFSNQITRDDSVTSIPHTCSFVCPLPWVEQHFNRNPAHYQKWASSKLTAILLKILRVKKYRLSPEGFGFAHMKAVTEAQLRIGQEVYIVSLHSPSVKPGCTPYVKSEAQYDAFKRSLVTYIDYLLRQKKGEAFLPGHFVKDD